MPIRDRRPHVVIAVVNLPVEKDRRVIRETLALESMGCRVTVICPRGTPKGTPPLRHVPGTHDAQIRPFPQPLAGSGLLSFVAEFIWSFVCVAWRLAGLMLRDRVDGMQVCNPPDMFWPIAIGFRVLRRPFVFDHHDLCPEVYRTKTASPNPVVDRVLLLFERLSMKFAHAVVATNTSFREIALARGGCPPEKVVVVRNGPRLAEVAASGGDAAVQPLKTIVYVGVLNEQDDVDMAVLAARHLADDYGRDGWKMVIAGDGDALPSLRQMAAEHGLHDVVHFPGWLEGHEVDALLRNATVAIQPDQATPMADLSTMAKTVEYVARGVPVVAVDLKETRRTAAEAAVYVPSGSPEQMAKAIAALLDDEASRATMRRIGLDRFRTELAWDHQARVYNAMWSRLLKLANPVPAQAGPAPIEMGAAPRHAAPGERR